jgi:hypothetical protein
MGALKTGLQTALSSGKLANILAGVGDITKEISGKLPQTPLDQGQEKRGEWVSDRERQEREAAALAAAAAAEEAKKKQTTTYIMIGVAAFLLLFGKKLMK